jgi:hypothetical protein
MLTSGNPQEKGCLDKLVIPIMVAVVAGIIVLFIQYRSGLFEKMDESSPTKPPAMSTVTVRTTNAYC